MSDTDNKKFLLALFGMTLTILMYSMWIPATLLFIFGGIYTKIILLILYIIQLFLDKNKTFFNFAVSLHISNYFNKFTLITEEEIQSSHSIIGMHPHGVVCIGGGLLMLNKEFAKLDFTFLGTNIVRFLPVSGILFRLLGIKGCHHSYFKELMKEGRNIAIIPGGFECAAITDHTRDKVYIKKRAGFIKYALQNGYKVYPCYIFNENKLFYTLSAFESARLFLTKFKIPGVFFVGKFLFYPRNDVDLCTVVGKALTFPKISNPTEEEVQKYHREYIESLKDLFNRYKDKFQCKEELLIL